MNLINPSINIRFKSLVVCALLLLTLFILPLHNSFAADDLSSLQDQIQKTKISQEQKNKQRKKLEKKLVQAEQESASIALLMEKTKQHILVERTRQIALTKQSEVLKKEKLNQQKLLRQQMISAYMAGKNDLAKLLLNQDDISQIVRAKSYYSYLNKARFESIEALEKTQAQLEKNKQEQAHSLTELKDLYAKQLISQKKLLNQRKERNKALRTLKQDINYQKIRIAQLSNAETRLKAEIQKQKVLNRKRELAAIEKAVAQKRRVVAAQKPTSISKYKGKLSWPIPGRVLSTFGSQRSSQVKWKGIAIAANEGEKVRAVASGKVLFSGYFKGYGMVIALDHSDNYITLYGYNQALLKETGDNVTQGDAIALAGHSGGQDKNILYFELSHKGKAQNPLRWLKTRSK